MKVAIAIGGVGDERSYAAKSLSDISDVLRNLGIEVSHINLNGGPISKKELKDINLIVAIDTNCRNPESRRNLINLATQSGIEYIGQADETFCLVRDKYRTNQSIRKIGISVPKSVLIDNPFTLPSSALLSTHLPSSYPTIIKDNFGSSSESLRVCKNHIGYRIGFGQLKAKSTALIVEEYIPGQEVTVPVVEVFGQTTVLSPIEITYKGLAYDRKTKKYLLNKLRIPPNLKRMYIDEAKEIALNIHKHLGCRYFSRIDIKVHNGKVFVLEANSEPVLSNDDFIARGARAVGVTYQDLIIGLLCNSSRFKRYLMASNREAFSNALQAFPQLNKDKKRTQPFGQVRVSEELVEGSNQVISGSITSVATVDSGEPLIAKVEMPDFVRIDREATPQHTL